MTAFPLETLSELRWSEEVDGLTRVGTFVEGQSRWTSRRLLVFKADDTLYGVNYEEGLTENQDMTTEEVFNCYDEDCECFEVEPYEYTETRYRAVMA